MPLGRAGVGLRVGQDGGREVVEGGYVCVRTDGNQWGWHQVPPLW